MYSRAEVEESIFPYDQSTMQFSYQGHDDAMRGLHTSYLGNRYPTIALPNDEEKKNPFSYELRLRDFATTQLRNRGTGPLGFFRRLFGIDSDSSRQARLSLQKEMCEIFNKAVDSTLLTTGQIEAMYVTLEKNLKTEKRGLFGGISPEVANLQSELMKKREEAISEHNRLREIDDWVQVRRKAQYKDPDMSKVSGYAEILNSPPETPLKTKLKEKFRDYMVNHSNFSEEIKTITDKINKVRETRDITNDKLQRKYNEIENLIEILRASVSVLEDSKSPGIADLLERIQELNNKNKQLLTLMKQDNAPKSNKAAAVSVAQQDSIFESAAAFFKPEAQEVKSHDHENELDITLSAIQIETKRYMNSLFPFPTFFKDDSERLEEIFRIVKKENPLSNSPGEELANKIILATTEKGIFIDSKIELQDAYALVSLMKVYHAAQETQNDPSAEAQQELLKMVNAAVGEANDNPEKFGASLKAYCDSLMAISLLAQKINVDAPKTVTPASLRTLEELGLKRGGRTGSQHDRRETAESLKEDALEKAKAELPAQREQRVQRP